MVEQVLVVIQQAMTLFLMIGVGYLVGRIGGVNDEGLKSLTFLLTRVALPCAIIKSLMVERNAEFFKSLAIAFVVITMVTALAAAGSLLLFRKQKRERRTVLQLGSIYGNAAFMGIALVQVVLGQDAIIYATLVMIVETIFLLLHTPAIMADGGGSLKKALLTPGVIAFVLGVIRLGSGITFPQPIGAAMNTIAGMNTPLAMVLVGVQMSKIDFKTVFTEPILYACALIKLVVIPVILMGLLYPLGLPPIAYCSIIICKGTMQSAILSVFAQDYGQDSALAARLIALSTILQIITLPLISAICHTFVM